VRVHGLVRVGGRSRAAASTLRSHTLRCYCLSYTYFLFFFTKRALMALMASQMMTMYLFSSLESMKGNHKEFRKVRLCVLRL
jgi:hypothetical protein